MIAAGLAGVDEALDAGPEYIGNAYVDNTLPALPATLRESVDLFSGSHLAESAFGRDVVQHYLHAARLEIREFEAAVTDWERRRYYERI
jgi:glutamine synthetase